MSLFKPKQYTIFEKAILGDEKAFNLFFNKSWQQMRLSLISLTSSEEEANHIFVKGMTILWENFIVQKKDPPENIQAYLYIICKNEWLAERKIKNNDPILLPIDDIYGELEEVENPSIKELKEAEEQDLGIKKLLKKAVENASEKCRKIIDLHIYQGVRLKKIWQSLGYASYQAIVQAKYNCKKKLGNYVFLQMQREKKQKQTKPSLTKQKNDR